MLSKTINNLIIDLKPRHREVLIGRFGLDGGSKKTLAGLGEKYGITRERVRQIEEESLELARERILKEKMSKEVLETIDRHLIGLGGLRRDNLLIPEIKIIFKDNNLHHWHLRFLSEVSGGRPLYYSGNSELHNFWYLNEKNIDFVNKFVLKLEKIIADKKEDLITNQQFYDYFTKIAKIHKISDFIGLNYVSISKKFNLNPFGDWGLNEWEEISPKTVREKAYLILKKEKEPLHFRKIAEAINKINFSGRPAHPQTVHNELIKDPRFVLVGRGMYGLSEFGYKPGITKEILKQILKEEGPLFPEEIIDLIEKQRFLKKNTILLNLQNKDYFKKMPDGRYAVK
ncbi:hypothetical protein JW698_00350 [Candidatus Wolfebacteria bacterium]|nr:hypothetical protein [Candidatus Wolfebacteria bacterium]